MGPPQQASHYVGFDIPQIRSLVRGLKGAAASSPTLHKDLAAVLADAQDDIEGPVTSSPLLQRVMINLFGMPLYPPGALSSPLDDIAGSSGRRCDHLEELKELEKDGITVDPSLALLDESTPSRADADEALEASRALKEKHFGVNGNRDALRSLANTSTGPSSVEFSWVLEDLSAEEREMLGDLRNATGASGLNPFDSIGLPHHERLDLASVLL